MKMWKFENYDVYEEMDLLRFEDKAGELLGYVAFNGNKEEMIAEMDEGADPIADGWEDGIGNTINIEGWGNVSND